MRGQLQKSMMLGAMLLGLSAVPAHAMDVEDVTVPFPFEVNHRMLPAGRYEIRTDEGNPGTLLIEGLRGNHAAAVVGSIPDYGKSPAGSKPAVTFVRQDDHYRLKAVWESNDYGRDVMGK